MEIGFQNILKLYPAAVLTVSMLIEFLSNRLTEDATVR